MAITLENLGAPSFKYTDEGALQATWERKIPDWADVADFLLELEGSTAQAGQSLFRVGQSNFPGKDWLLLSSVDVEPFDANRATTDDTYGVPTCDAGAKVTLHYRTLEYNTGPAGQDPDPDEPDVEPYVTWTVDGDAGMVRADHDSVKWKIADTEGNQDVAEDAEYAFPVPIVRHSLQWHKLPKVPLQNLIYMLGKVNSVTFLGHGPESVLFEKFSSTKHRFSDGSKYYDLTLNLAARILKFNYALHGADANDPLQVVALPNQGPGWNHFLRNTEAVDETAHDKWQPVVTKAGDERLLATVDLNQLWNMEQES